MFSTNCSSFMYSPLKACLCAYVYSLAGGISLKTLQHRNVIFIFFFFHASAVCSWEVRTALGCAWTNCKCKRNFACFLSRWRRDVAVTSCYVLSTKWTKIDSIPLICWQTINNRRKKLLYTIQLSRTTLFQNKQCDVDCICIWFVCQNQTMPQGRVVMKRNLVKFTVFETTFKTYHSYFNICKTIRGK